MIVNNIPRPSVDYNTRQNHIDRQLADLKTIDIIRIDAINKQRLERIDANARINLNYLNLKELNLYTPADKRQEYYDYRRLLFVGMNFDRYA